MSTDVNHCSFENPYTPATNKYTMSYSLFILGIFIVLSSASAQTVPKVSPQSPSSHSVKLALSDPTQLKFDVAFVDTKELDAYGLATDQIDNCRTGAKVAAMLVDLTQKGEVLQSVTRRVQDTQEIYLLLGKSLDGYSPIPSTTSEGGGITIHTADTGLVQVNVTPKRLTANLESVELSTVTCLSPPRSRPEIPPSISTMRGNADFRLTNGETGLLAQYIEGGTYHKAMLVFTTPTLSMPNLPGAQSGAASAMQPIEKRIRFRMTVLHGTDVSIAPFLADFANVSEPDSGSLVGRVCRYGEGVEMAKLLAMLLGANLEDRPNFIIEDGTKIRSGASDGRAFIWYSVMPLVQDVHTANIDVKFDVPRNTGDPSKSTDRNLSSDSIEITKLMQSGNTYCWMFQPDSAPKSGYTLVFFEPNSFSVANKIDH